MGRSKLLASTELILDSMFRGSAGSDLRITGASFDSYSGCVVLEIDGPNVPDSEFVSALCTEERFSVKFEPVGR